MFKIKSIVFLLCFLSGSLGFAQTKVKLNVNSSEFTRILDGVLLTENDSVNVKIKDIFRFSDIDLIESIGLDSSLSPFMVMNSDNEKYEPYRDLVPIEIKKYQLPFVYNNQIVSYKDAFKRNDVKYINKSKIDGKVTPFGYLEFTK